MAVSDPPVSPTPRLVTERFESARTTLTSPDTWSLLAFLDNPHEDQPDQADDETYWDEETAPVLETTQETAERGLITTQHTVSATRAPFFALALDSFFKTRCTPAIDLESPNRNSTYHIRAARLPAIAGHATDTATPHETTLSTSTAGEWCWLNDALTAVIRARDATPRHSRATPTNAGTGPTPAEDPVETVTEQKDRETSTESVFDSAVGEFFHGVRLRNRVQILLDGGDDISNCTVFDVSDAVHAPPEAITAIFAPAFAAIHLDAPVTIPGLISAKAHSDCGIDPVSMFTTVNALEESIRNVYDPGKFAMLTLHYQTKLMENQATPLSALTPRV